MREPAALSSFLLSRGLRLRNAIAGRAILGALGASAKNIFDVADASLFSSSSASSTSSSSSSTSTPTPQQQREIVGFVGLGAMGSRMASNVLREFSLVACDASKASVDSFVAGAARVETKNSVVGALAVVELFAKARQLAGGTSTPAAVLTSLPSPAAVRDVYLGEEGLIRLAAEAASAAAEKKKSNNDGAPSPTSTILVELSTIDPKTALEVSEAVEEENTRRQTTKESPLLRFLSSPVSGGTGAAAKGTLTVLAGGPHSSRDAARRFVSPFASKVIAAGDSPGDGDAAKLANNLALAIQMVSVAEALALASRLSPSLSASKMIEILNESSGKCWSSEVYPPLPELRDDYKGGFAAALMLKDLRLASEAAKESSPFSSAVSLPTPMGDAAATAYRACPPGEDFSSVFRHFYGEGKG